MTVQRRLDRKAKAAITAVMFVFLLIVGLGLRSCVVALSPEQTVAAPDSDKDQLVLVGKETMVVPSGSVGSKMVSWLTGGGTGTRAFDVGDQAFRPGSDELTQLGLLRLERFAGMMRADSGLKARVILFTDGVSRLDDQLADKRTARIRTELIARRVPISRISTESRASPVNAANSNRKQPPIVVVLSK